MKALTGGWRDDGQSRRAVAADRASDHDVVVPDCCEGCEAFRVLLTSFALLPPALRGTDLVSTVPDFVAGALAWIGGLATDPCPVAVPPVNSTMAWRAAADRDPAERWFRDKLVGAFAAA